MVVSQNKGTPNIKPNILQSLFYGDPQNGTPNFRKPPEFLARVRVFRFRVSGLYVGAPGEYW